MKKLSLIILLFVLHIHVLNAQNHSQYIIDLFDGAKENFGDENFVLALEKYNKLVNLKPKDITFNYEYGRCAALTKTEIQNGINSLELVYNNNYRVNDAKYYLAQLYHLSNRFQKSINLLYTFIENENKKTTINTEQINDAKHLINQCNNAIDLIKTPINITFDNLGNNINSTQDDFNPFVPLDESFIIYSSNKSFDRDYGVFISNIYVSYPTDSVWMFAKKQKKLNTYDNEIIYSSSPDGKNILMGRGLDYGVDIEHIKHKGKSFKLNEGNPIFKLVNSKEKETGATITNNEKTVLFSVNAEGSMGGSDIYMIKLKPNNEWSNPMNIGEEINTKYDEILPNLSADEKKLYFASNGHNSMGGFDIFVSNWDEENNKWGKPSNLGYPINTVYDNMTISYPTDNKYAYISANRKNGKGGLDIYRINFNNIDKRYSILKGTVYNSNVSEKKLYNTKDGEISIEIYDKEENLYGQYAINQQKSTFIAALPKGEYIIRIELIDKNKTYSENISIKDKNNFVFEINKNLYLDK